MIGVVAGHLTFKALSFSKAVDVPDVRGKGMIEASRLLRSKGLFIRIEGEDYDSSVSEGSVVRQDIPPNNKVKEGRGIGVIVSKGPKVRYVPEVVGQSLSEAEEILRGKGIKIRKVIYVHSASVPRDAIVAQRPEPNEKGGDAFSVVVSLGDYEQ